MADKQSNGSEGLYAMGMLRGVHGRTEQRTKRQPYESKIPNDESLEALRQLRTGEVIRYNSVREMMDDILSDE